MKNQLRSSPQPIAWLAICLAALLVFFTDPLPVQAASRISPQLEEQVLQILRNHPEVILESVQAYQEQQQAEVQRTRQTFLYQLQVEPEKLIGQSPATGTIENKILLIEFADFQCSYCAKAYVTVKEFIKKRQNEVTLVYKHFPIATIHPEAMAAAKAAWAAGQQEQFWQYYDALFTEQSQLGEAFYLATAQKLGLNLEQFERDRTSAAASEAIQADMQLAESLKIEGTPFFVLQDRVFSGAIQLSDLEQALAQIKQS